MDHPFQAESAGGNIDNSQYHQGLLGKFLRAEKGEEAKYHQAYDGRQYMDQYQFRSHPGQAFTVIPDTCNLPDTIKIQSEGSKKDEELGSVINEVDLPYLLRTQDP